VTFRPPLLSAAISTCSPLGQGSIRFATALGNDHHEYAQAQARSNAPVFAAYLDRSSDGGRTWQGWLDTVDNAGSTITMWTDPEYDGPPYVSRACINVNGYSACTPWH